MNCVIRSTHAFNGLRMLELNIRSPEAILINTEILQRKSGVLPFAVIHPGIFADLDGASEFAHQNKGYRYSSAGT